MVYVKSFHLNLTFLQNLTIIYLAILTLAMNVQSSKSSNFKKASGNSHHTSQVSDNVKFNGNRNKRSTTNPNLSNIEIQQSVDKHNELRSQENATGMYYLVWDDELASIAQDWADNCDFIHDLPVNASHSEYGTTIGQNLYISTGFNLNVEGVIQLWFDEKYYYHLDTRDCDEGEICGHYTQLVWASSYQIGCGFAECSPLIDSSANLTWDRGIYYVCEYGPAGNLQGKQPYSIGTPCTECDIGSFNCYQNMCVENCDVANVTCQCNAESDGVCQNNGAVSSDCTCSCADGWTNNNCTQECTDWHHNCRIGYPWYPRQCHLHAQVREGCPLMCGECVEAPVITTSTTTTNIPVSTSPVTSSTTTTATTAVVASSTTTTTTAAAVSSTTTTTIAAASSISSMSTESTAASTGVTSSTSLAGGVTSTSGVVSDSVTSSTSSPVPEDNRAISFSGSFVVNVVATAVIIFNIIVF